MKKLITKSLFDAVYNCDISKDGDMLRYYNRINIYEFVHMNLKQWANFKNVFNIIDWSGEPEEILAKAEELMNEIN